MNVALSCTVALKYFVNRATVVLTEQMYTNGAGAGGAHVCGRWRRYPVRAAAIAAVKGAPI